MPFRRDTWALGCFISLRPGRAGESPACRCEYAALADGGTGRAKIFPTDRIPCVHRPGAVDFAPGPERGPFLEAPAHRLAAACVPPRRSPWQGRHPRRDLRSHRLPPEVRHPAAQPLRHAPVATYPRQAASHLPAHRQGPRRHVVRARPPRGSAAPRPHGRGSGVGPPAVSARRLDRAPAPVDECADDRSATGDLPQADRTAAPRDERQSRIAGDMEAR